MSFPRYPKYKDSGVEWLGEMPEHWQVFALKRLVNLKSGESITAESIEESGTYPVYGGNGLRGYTESYTHEGLFALIGRQGALCGNINYADGRFWASEHAVVVNPRAALIVGWMGELLRAMNLNQYSVSAAQPGLSVEIVGALSIPVPPIDEQFAIAAFLDRETAKIDALVAEQQNLIALLKEKRQSLISHAVTKGLDPDVPMKDSGVAWLGAVPAHWEIGPLKRFAEVIDCKHHTVEFLGEGLPIVSIRELRDDRIDLSDAKRTSQAEWDFLREGRIPQAGDLIFCRNASVGAVGYVEAGQEFCMGQDVCLIRPATTSRFTHFQLSSSIVREQIEAFLVGATIRRANVAEIRGLVMTWPPVKEQVRISEYLIDETGQFDELMQEAETTIALLQERRTALISAAVTGKIDVRHVAVASAEPTPEPA